MLTNNTKKSVVLGALLATATAHAQDADLQNQIDALKQQIQTLQSQTQTNKDLISNSLGGSQESNVQFHGFMSLGLSQFSETEIDDIEYYNGQDSSPSVTPNTWVGLQMNASLYEGGDLVFQVVSKGTEDFEPETEWLYLKQDLGNGFNAQIGRIRFPAFIDSEVVYIGNTYPTIAPPAEIYSVLPMSHLDGISVNHSMDLGEWALDSKFVLWGESEKGTSGYKLGLKEVHGAVFSFTRDYLTMRIGAFKGYESINIDYAADDVVLDDINESFGDDLTYTTAAIRFDNAQFYFSTEAINIKSDNDMLDENENWNATVGYYFGKVMAYVGASKTHVTNEDELTAALNEAIPGTFNYNHPDYGSIPLTAGQLFGGWLVRQQSTSVVGIKWDFNPRATFKVQVQKVEDFDDTFGNFSSSSRDGAFDHMYIYDIAVQATF